MIFKRRAFAGAVWAEQSVNLAGATSRLRSRTATTGSPAKRDRENLSLGREPRRRVQSWRISKPRATGGSSQVDSRLLADVRPQFALPDRLEERAHFLFLAGRLHFDAAIARLRTQPVTSKPFAMCLTDQRKPTPWTLPSKKT